MTVEFNPPQWARDLRPAAVRGTGSAAPEQYVPIAGSPEVYDIVSHGAQYGKGRRYGITKPTLIIFHTTESTNFIGNLTYDMRRPETVGATAFYGEGQLAHTTPEINRPWTTGRWNDGSLTLEVCGRASWSVLQWKTAEPNIVEDLVWITTDWCKRYEIPPVWLTAEQIAHGACRQGASPWKPMGDIPGLCDHRLANDAAIMLGHDPGKYSHHDVGEGLRTILIHEVIPQVVHYLTTNQEEEEEMQEYMLIPPTGYARIIGPDGNPVTAPWFYFRGGDVRYGTGEDRDRIKSEVGPSALIQDPNPERWVWTYRQVFGEVPIAAPAA